MFRHIIWDFDGTLFDTYPAMASALCDTLGAHGVEAHYGQVYALMKQSISVAFDFYSQRAEWGEELETEYAARRRAIEKDKCAPYPGAVELLRDIVESGRKNYIFTHRGKTLTPLLEKHGMRGLFEECVTSESGFARKPAPDGILYLMKKYAMNSSETAMVGDRELDILSGKNAGIVTCAYCDGSGVEINFADHVAGDMAGLREILMK